MRDSNRKYVKAILNIWIALLVILLVVFLLPKALWFFLPFLVGWIISLIASPLVRFFEEKLKIRRKAGSAFVIITVLALVILACYLIGAKLVRETIGFVQDIPQMWQEMEEDFDDMSDNLSIVYNKLPTDMQDKLSNLTESVNEYIGQIAGELSSPTIAAVGNFAKQLPTVIIGIIMCLLSAYFFVAEKNELKEKLKNWMPESILRPYTIMKHSMVNALGGYLKAQFKIEIWVYILIVIGLLILKVPYAFFLGIGIAILDLLPFFGTGTVMLPWAIIKFLSEDYKMTIGLLIIWGVSQLLRQVIQPKIVGDSIGLPPLPTLFLLYIGYKVGGVIGMIIAVPIGIIILTLYKEGLFDTTKNSISILVAGINHFREITPSDMTIVEERKKETVESLTAVEKKYNKTKNGEGS